MGERHDARVKRNELDAKSLQRIRLEDAVRRRNWWRRRKSGARAIPGFSVSVDFINAAERTGLLEGVDRAGIARAAAEVLDDWAKRTELKPH
jgi:hypothetical protein